jgi:hypothetical protein
MQTFLNEYSFSATAEYLDNKRLNKQLTESRQILDILLINPNARWRNHPAVLMWKGHEYALWLYTKRIREECIERGFNVEKNTLQLQKHFQIMSDNPLTNSSMPEWWEDEVLKERVVVTHRARLYVKNPVHYARYERFLEPAENMRCCSHCNYFWPSHWEKNKQQFLITNKKRSK